MIRSLPTITSKTIEELISSEQKADLIERFQRTQPELYDSLLVLSDANEEKLAALILAATLTHAGLEKEIEGRNFTRV